MLTVFRKPTPPRGLQVLIGPAALPTFDDDAFTRWALEQGAIQGVTPHRVAALADEFAEVAECRPRAEGMPDYMKRGQWVDLLFPTSPDDFDAEAFTEWMVELGLTHKMRARTLRDYANWWCLVHQRRPILASNEGGPSSLEPHGWVKRRAPARVSGKGEIERDSFYQWVGARQRAAA